jgi:hypothetical protein
MQPVGATVQSRAASGESEVAQHGGVVAPALPPDLYRALVQTHSSETVFPPRGSSHGSRVAIQTSASECGSM